MALAHFGGTIVCATPTGLRTTLPDGTVVHAEPHDTVGQRATAERLGYRGDVLAMTREHDLVHAALAHLLGLPVSPALAAALHPERWGDPLVALDEAATMAVQAYARATGVDLVRRWTGRR